MLTTTGPDIYVATMTICITDSYDGLEETLNHIKSLNISIYPGENITDYCDEIFVDADLLDSAGAFNNEHLGYITRIFEYAYSYRLCLWDIQKYKDITDFIKNICVRIMDFIPPEELIAYESRVK